MHQPRNRNGAGEFRRRKGIDRLVELPGSVQIDHRPYAIID